MLGRGPCARLPRAAGALLAAVTIAGCGTQSRGSALAPATVKASLAGSPAPLAALHAQANRLLLGGRAAFARELAALRGFPVVVNKWASWCQPCQKEFPVFQREALAFGRRVAVLGIDGKEPSTSPGTSFLRRFPVSYPSFFDPQENIAASIQASTYYPQTVYFDRRGGIVTVHDGPYLSAGDLARDIERYCLGAA